jgi:hypothetical protein
MLFYMPCPITYRNIYISTNTQCTHPQRQTHTEEKKLKLLLPGTDQGDRTRHLGVGCRLSFLRPVPCFGTDLPPFCNLHPNAWWPTPAAGSAGMCKLLPVSREDPSPYTAFSHENFPPFYSPMSSPWFGEHGSWGGTCVYFKLTAQKCGSS